MSFAEFAASIDREANPLPGTMAPLAALWHDRKGDWARAHQLVQDDDGREAAWVHAYLHRKEGDHGNAGYWYARARRPQVAPTVPLDAEWETIARALLADPAPAA
jgi:hypothetical protein